jgi:hypothetical protein
MMLNMLELTIGKGFESLKTSAWMTKTPIEQ